MLILLLIAVLSIGFSFLCSILEAVLLSLTPSYIARLRDEQPALHASLEHMKANIDRPLAAILTVKALINKRIFFNALRLSGLLPKGGNDSTEA